jgi:hypothetical protein
MTKKRCFVCKKKIKSVIPYQCRCEQYFCRLHKEHNCTFDYKEYHKKKLKKENPKVVHPKFVKL